MLLQTQRGLAQRKNAEAVGQFEFVGERCGEMPRPVMLKVGFGQLG